MIKSRTFDVELAAKFGLNNAIFLQDLAYWIEVNKKRDQAFRDGRYWTYSTTEELANRHPYWTKNQIRHIVDTCKQSGWIVVEHYDKSNYNRRNWYSIAGEVMDIISFGETNSSNTKENINQHDDGNITHRVDSDCNSIKNNNKNLISKNDKNISQYIPKSDKKDIFEESLFNYFWDSYPKKVGKQDAIKAWNRLKPDISIFNAIQDSIALWKQTDQWKNQQYIPNPATWLNGRRWEDEIKTNPQNQYDAERMMYDYGEDESGISSW